MIHSLEMERTITQKITLKKRTKWKQRVLITGVRGEDSLGQEAGIVCVCDFVHSMCVSSTPFMGRDEAQSAAPKVNRAPMQFVL